MLTIVCISEYGKQIYELKFQLKNIEMVALARNGFRLVQNVSKWVAM